MKVLAAKPGSLDNQHGRENLVPRLVLWPPQINNRKRRFEEVDR